MQTSGEEQVHTQENKQSRKHGIYGHKELNTKIT